jgi:hypothetical protein
MLAYYYGDPHNHPELAMEEDFDPLLFAVENGEFGEAAAHATAGEIYRQSLLALSPADRVAFEGHLATRGLRLVEDGSYWQFASASDPDEET